MPSAVASLYEPLIERDLEAVPEAVRRFREEQGVEEAAIAIARFAVLAFAPSQHSKHALLCCAAALELREEFGDQWEALLIECARYAAGSRHPWSEPPIPEPPPVEADHPSDAQELRAAMTARDRARGERWLAARLSQPQLREDLFTVASEDLEDLGHKLIVAVAAEELSVTLGERGRYLCLRTAIWEMTAYGGATSSAESDADAAVTLQSAIADCVEEEGSLESAHRIFLLEAALATGQQSVIGRVLRRVASARNPRIPTHSAQPHHAAPQVYPLARDYGQFLKSLAVAKRLRARFPAMALDAFVAACRRNLDQAPSMEEWSFA